MYWFDNFYWFKKKFCKDANTKSINISIEIDGKAIKITYKGWNEIHQLM
jgi:hypothetical protein